MNKAFQRVGSALFALSLMVFFLASCGGGSGSSQSSSGRPTSSEPYVMEHAVPDAPPLEKVVYEATDEILNAPMYSPVIQIGDTVLTFPFQYSELVAAGAVLTDKDVTADYLLNAGETKGASFKIGGTTFGINFSNDTEERGTLKEATATGIYGVRGEDIFYPFGIRVGTPLSELTEKWGNPTEEKSESATLKLDFLEYPVDGRYLSSLNDGAFSVTGNRYEIRIDRNTSLISYISASIGPTTMETTPQLVSSTETMMGRKGLETIDYEVKYSYSTPISQNQRNDTMYIIITANDTPYVVALDSKPHVRSLPGEPYSGQSTKPISEVTLRSEINGSEWSDTHEVEVLELTEDVGRAVGYRSTETALHGVGQYITHNCGIKTTGSALVPIYPSQELSDEAIAIFKQMMADLVMSIQVESIEEKA